MATVLRSTAALSPAEARDLTNRIRSTAEGLASLLQEAYKREAWRALGYASWRDYATTELDILQSYAYRLLDQAKVIAAIQDAAGGFLPMGEISEREAGGTVLVLHSVSELVEELKRMGAPIA